MAYIPRQDAKTIIIAATLIRETPKAYMFDLEGDEVWFPKSQVVFNAKESKVEVPTWLLDQNKIVY